MRASFRTSVELALLAALIATAPVAWAAEGAAAQPIAAENVSANGISWQLSGAFDEVALTVSGPGYQKTDVVRHGANPSFEAFGRSSQLLADGIYNFELRVIPQPPVELVLAVEQAKADRDEEAYDRLSTELQKWGADLEPMVQWGSFRLTGGLLERLYDRDATPDEKEVAE